MQQGLQPAGHRHIGQECTVGTGTDHTGTGVSDLDSILISIGTDGDSMTAGIGDQSGGTIRGTGADRDVIGHTILGITGRITDQDSGLIITITAGEVQTSTISTGETEAQQTLIADLTEWA